MSGDGRGGSSVAARACAAVLALVALGACVPVPEEERGVPDDVLVAEIEQIEGVVDVQGGYGDCFGCSPGYTFEIEVDDRPDPLCVLDTVYAILWQGRPARTDVTVGRGIDWWGWDQLVDDGRGATPEERYGPRPQTGKLVPPEPPACG